MLVLSRKVGEKLRIGNDIVITVVRTTGTNVRLGIEAPRDLSILRGELENELNAALANELGLTAPEDGSAGENTQPAQ